MSKNSEIPKIYYENLRIKTENKQEYMAVDVTEFSEDIYKLDPSQFQIKIEKIEIEDSHYHHQHSSDTDEELHFKDISIKEDNEAVPKKCGERNKGTPRSRELTTKSPEILGTLLQSKENIAYEKRLLNINKRHKKLDFNKKNDENSCSSDKKLEKISKQKRFSCDLCEKSYTLRHNLARHLKTHYPERYPQKTYLYICNHCGKNFRDNFSFTRHLMTHTRERPFLCNYCDKSFSQKPNLIRHIRIHTGEKPYSCSYCKKKFAQKGDLTLHVRHHTDDRPYTCHVCGNKFKQLGNLKLHVKRHHKT